jgi:hypothetical protein
MSKLLENATALYRAMDEAATTETLDGIGECRVFRGSLVRVYRSLDISQAYYSEVRRGLIESDCIVILRRGSKHSESVVLLEKEPDESSLVTYESLGLTDGPTAAIVYRELKDLRRLIGSISIPDALVNIERRLQELEQKVSSIQQQLTHKRNINT